MASLPESLRNVPAAHGYVQELEAFAERSCVPTMRDGVRASRMGLLAIAAIRTGQPQR